MKNTIYFILYLITAFCFSCNSFSNKDIEKAFSIPEISGDSITNNDVDTIVDRKAKENFLVEGSPKKSKSKINDWGINKFIIECPENYVTNLMQEIEYYKKEWENVENPFIATYKGNYFGDYHHINFEDSNEKSYDFGFGENDFGDILLFFNDEQINDNPKYLGKQFNIFWEWKISSFPCCSGKQELVKAYYPSIIKLELLKTNANRVDGSASVN